MPSVIPEKIVVNEFTKLDDLVVQIKGKLFLNIRNVYLSASNETMFENITSYNPFYGIDKLEDSYPEFRGVLLNNFLFSEKTLIFQLPEIPKIEGFVDVIVENEAGYGKLTTDSFTPYISSFPGSVNIQSPLVSGIEIIIR